jgi:hypothetical protein
MGSIVVVVKDSVDDACSDRIMEGVMYAGGVVETRKGKCQQQNGAAEQSEKEKKRGGTGY